MKPEEKIASLNKFSEFFQGMRTLKIFEDKISTASTLSHFSTSSILDSGEDMSLVVGCVSFYVVALTMRPVAQVHYHKLITGTSYLTNRLLILSGHIRADQNHHPVTN